MVKKIQVYAGDKHFESMTALAKWLQIPKITLTNLFGKNKEIFYNGITLKKADPEPDTVKHYTPRKKTNWDRRPKPVLIDGVAYNSCHEAERVLRFPKNVLGGALNNGQTFYKGHKIEYVYPSDAPKQNKTKIGVYCENLNKHFQSISDAAKFADVDGWTMSKKMEAAGKFIDTKGNVYIREKPMNSINVYKNTGPTLKRNVTKEYTRTVIKDKPVETKNEVPAIVRQLVQDKIIDLLKNAEHFDEIKELMKYVGLTKIILSLDEIENN